MSQADSRSHRDDSPTSSDVPPEVVLEDARCPLGCPDDDEVLFRGRDTITHLDGEFQVVRCRGCGLARTNPRPDAATMGYYYPDAYPNYGGIQEPLLQRDGGVVSRLKALVRREAQRSRRLPSVKPGRLLEVGCASGDFLAHAAATGWQVEGVELSAFAAERARRRGFTVFQGSLESVALEESRYDVIAAWMVFEHLHEPVPALKKLRAAARPDGYLAFSVPDFRAAVVTLFEEHWQDLHVPAHLYHFTPETIAKVLDAAGWRVESISHQRNVSAWMVSSAWWLESRGAPRWLTSKIGRYPEWGIAARLPLYPLATAAALLGQSGRMNVTARPNTSSST